MQPELLSRTYVVNAKRDCPAIDRSTDRTHETRCIGLPVLSELAFECYGVPSLCYGVDSLFSWFYNSRVVEQDLNLDARNALILATGFRSTHIIPIIGGVPDLRGCRRVPLGGAHITKHLEVRAIDCLRGRHSRTHVVLNGAANAQAQVPSAQGVCDSTASSCTLGG